MKIVGREQEQEALQKYYDSQRPEFLTVYGRMRVGKTYLIKEFFRSDFSFYATGLANASMKEQLKSFSLSLKKHGYQGKDPASWLEAFSTLQTLLESSNRVGKKVIFIDELSWFDTPRSGFLTGLEFFWNSWASSRPDLLFIVCGSISSWMINKLIKNHGGLYNRVTQRMKLEPFTLSECEEYFKTNNIVLSRYQILEHYMVFGGIPYYLNMIERGLSTTQNIDALCFGSTAPLRKEFNEVFASLFKDPRRHEQIVRAIARAAKGITREQLVKSTGIANGGSLTMVLEELEQCGFIRKYHAVGKKRKDTLYQLIDHFSNFHLNFLTDNKSDEDGYWSKYSNSPAYNAWSGYSFEMICLSHVKQIKQSLGIAGVIAPVYSWRSSAQDGIGAQVDLVIDRNDGITNLCEAKYSIEEFSIDKEYETRLRNKIASYRAETRTKKAIHITMITTYGVRKNTYSGIVQSDLVIADLFS